MKESIINQVAARFAANNETRKAPPIAQANAVALAEASLGFTIPPLLRSLYLTVANGGFGPGYGIIGVDGGHASNLGTLVNTYDQINKGADYLGLKWRRGLLPFCEWGGNVFSCVDCNESTNRVYQSNECVVRPTKYNLDEFFERWLEGKNLMHIGKPPSVEMINPFTRKTVRVSGVQKNSK